MFLFLYILFLLERETRDQIKDLIQEQDEKETD